MDIATKSKSRRQEIRKNRPDASRFDWDQLKEKGIPQGAALAGVFFILTASILLLRQDVLPYRPGQPINYDVHARVSFSFPDKSKLASEQARARRREPRVYDADEQAWAQLREDLLSLPARMSATPGGGEPPADLRAVFRDPSVWTQLRNAMPQRQRQPDGTFLDVKRNLDGTLNDAGLYEDAVDTFVRSLADYRSPAAANSPLVLLAPNEFQAERQAAESPDSRRQIRVGPATIDFAAIKPVDDRQELPGIIRSLIEKAGSGFRGGQFQYELADYVLTKLRPTHRFDEAATTQRGNQAAMAVPPTAGNRKIDKGEIFVPHTNAVKPALDEADVQLLRLENAAYLSKLNGSEWKPRLATTGIALIITLVLMAYVAAFQPRIVKNHARAAAIIALLIAMLLLAALAGTSNGPIYLFGVAPTMLVVMILAIAYDRRFAIGVGSIHALLVTIALTETAAFFLMLWAGVLTAGFMLDAVRTRSKLVEVGGAASIVMMVAACAAGLLELESGQFVLRNSLFAGAGGLIAGFIVLGILPFIEKTFRITTSMTLLELADVSQPLLRRLQVEAAGTYNHSMQVAILAEAAAEAIGADSLLCRVAAYYHDVGKINKPDYFIENQSEGHNRHLNLDPNLSLLIIIGHVKDGIELAREYNLPTSVIPFIQQHHGTTIVEYFYRRACSQQEQRDPTTLVSETQFRYPGPRPRTKEVAILMIADAVESATRALEEPSPAQIEGLVRDLAKRRLDDGQFDECDITMKDLERVKRSLIKTLAGIYHGRIAYPPASAPTLMNTIVPATPTGAGPPLTSGDLSADVRSA